MLGLDGIFTQGSPPLFHLSQGVPKIASWLPSQEAGQMNRRQGLTLGWINQVLENTSGLHSVLTVLIL